MMSKNDEKELENQIEQKKAHLDQFHRFETIGSVVEEFRIGKIEIKHLGLFEMWDTEKQSKIIERILLQLHAPSITLVDLGKEKEIVSGAEYIISVFNLNNGKLRLKGLKYLTKLNGCRIDDLPEEIRDNINASGAFLNIYDKETGQKFDTNQLKEWSM